MITTVYKIDPKSAITEAAALMVEKDVGCLLVTQGRGPIGIITETDILREVTRTGANSKVAVKDVMSVNLIVATTGMSIGEAAKKMIENHIKRLVVVGEDTSFIGLVTMTDLIKWVAEHRGLSDSLRNLVRHDLP